MFRVVAVSVRGDLYLMGNPSVHPINPPGQHDGQVPDGVGTEFTSIVDAQRYTRTELGPLSSYHQVRVVGQAGTTVMRGSRTGRGGTGRSWTWDAPDQGAGSQGSLAAPRTGRLG